MKSPFSVSKTLSRMRVALIVILLFPVLSGISLTAGAAEKPRVIVLTDISNEPDDEESMVRFLVYSNEYDVEGLIATTSVWLRENPREDLIRRQIRAYGEVRENLLQHAEGFPETAQLLKVTRTGQNGFGMDAVGYGKSTHGSQHIIDVVDRPDDRPVWITVWGGANTLAQALWDVKYNRSPEELKEFVSKLRVYTISDQDNSGRWMRITFPELFYIVSPSHVGGGEYYKSTWSGIAGDRHYRNGPYHFFELVDNPWLRENIIEDQGPLGALYPELAYIMEGDTPSFLNLINNGLGSHISPSYGGWGGRYRHFQSYAETRPIWTNARDTFEARDGSTHTTAQATIWRWREAYQYDFAARMDWCVNSYKDANHNPEVVVNGNPGKEVIHIDAKPGERIALDADGTSDPDGNALSYHWWNYQEAGSYGKTVAIPDYKDNSVQFLVPEDADDDQFHVICEVRDNGEPNLFAYRRIIIKTNE